MFNIAVLVSGSGSNLQSIIDGTLNGEIKGRVSVVISDRPCYALERAIKHNIKTYMLERKEYKDKLSDEILDKLEDADLIVLSGYLSILKGKILQKFKHKIINIHPSLLPLFGGNGMYGLRVHEAAIDAGVKVSGCTVHFVDEDTDHGPIILQSTVPVYFNDTAKSLQERIIVVEHKTLVMAVKLIALGKVKVIDNKVQISEGEDKID